MRVIVRVYTDSGKSVGEAYVRKLTDERYVLDTAQDIENHLERMWQVIEDEEGDDDSADIKSSLSVSSI